MAICLSEVSKLIEERISKEESQVDRDQMGRVLFIEDGIAHALGAIEEHVDRPNQRLQHAMSLL